jgi:ABC-2 type transport system ATP-binding protein
MLELSNVTKSYGAVTAVANMSFRAERGVLGLIGQNGAGKTTLMQMIATLSRPSAGTILFQNSDIVKKPNAIRARLGFLPQDFGVFPNLTAYEFLQYFAALKGVANPARIRQLLEMVNLHEHAHRQAATFSGGMRRRLGIAQALLNDPDIVVVDEPTAGLDPEERLRFRNLLGELGTRKLIIVSTHIVSDIESIASQIAIMRSGALVKFATPDALIAAARGHVWALQVPRAELEQLRTRHQVLQAQPMRGTPATASDALFDVRVTHQQPTQQQPAAQSSNTAALSELPGQIDAPHTNARSVEPTLEEALMVHMASGAETGLGA